MQVCRFTHATLDEPRLGVAEDGQVTTIEIETGTETGTETGSLPEALAEYDWASLRDAATGPVIDRNDVTFHAPVERPTNLIGVGLNYVGHAEEGGFDVPTEPVFFAKSPSSIADPENTITRHDGVTDLHYEGEFGFVVGDLAREVAESAALEHVFGFLAGNDVTARDMQLRDLEAANPWFRSKSMDTFTPLGPRVTPVGEGVDPANARIETRLNGEVVQSSATDDLVFSVPEIVAYVSKHVTLLPGDVVLTGTPAGVGGMTPGDEVEVEVSGVGVLRNGVGDP